MRLEQFMKDIDLCEKEMANILHRIHSTGPVSPEDFETLAYIKKFQPNTFKKYELKLINLAGLFFKIKEPKSFLEEVYSIFAKSIKEATGSTLTPVQADIYKKISEKIFFSFSAPTSTGKSYLFNKLIKESKGDIIIVVPSRALIAEYISIIKILVDKSVLILQFIDVVNTKKTSRRIFVITPERGTELFKNLDRLNIELILFDEAQVSEEENLRGLRFDSFVRRTANSIPTAKKVFAHPFVKNPEAQLKKHNFDTNSDSRPYTQNSVGKIFLSHKDGKFSYFSPFEKAASSKKLLSDRDIIKDKILANRTILIYVSKSNIYSDSFTKDFATYIKICKKIRNSEALNYIKKVREFIGASPSGEKEKYSHLVELMKRGIVIHHGSMPLKVRLLIEEFVKKDFARICFCTSTLAQGINMPFDVVWIKNFLFNGSTHKKILDLKNLIGRAGRSTTESNSFDYGYVVIEEENVLKFCRRIKDDPLLSEKSKIDEEFGEMDEDKKDMVEAVKNDTFNNDLQLTQTQVERIKNSDIEEDIKYILDNFLIDGSPITARRYHTIPKANKIKIKTAFKRIYLAHLRRTELGKGESSVLSAAIPILLWQIQGKSFSEVISLRHAYLSKKDERLDIARRLKNKEINKKESQEELKKLTIEYSQIANSLPDKSLTRSVPLYKTGTPITEIKYDTIVYDTYDYLDKVISFSLKDPLSGAFALYYEKTGDARAVILSNYIKYGTNDPTEIWLVRYGFSFDDIEWIKEHVKNISEEEIVFKDSIKELNEEQFKVIERFVN